MRILLQWTNGFPVPLVPHATSHNESVSALNEQIKLGVGNMLRGVLVWRLGKVQHEYYRSKRNFKSTGEQWIRRLTQFFSLSLTIFGNADVKH